MWATQNNHIRLLAKLGAINFLDVFPNIPMNHSWFCFSDIHQATWDYLPPNYFPTAGHWLLLLLLFTCSWSCSYSWSHASYPTPALILVTCSSSWSYSCSYSGHLLLFLVTCSYSCSCSWFCFCFCLLLVTCSCSYSWSPALAPASTIMTTQTWVLYSSQRILHKRGLFI